MFGYVRPCIPELRVRENETYRAVYCTLCRVLGQRYGLLARLTLSYDFTFLALLRLGLLPSCTGFEQRRCVVNPLKKCNTCKRVGDALDGVAAGCVLLSYSKLNDSVADSGFFKGLGFRFLRLIARLPQKKAARAFPKLAGQVADYEKRQAIIEREGESRPDAACEPTARMLSALFALCGEGEAATRVLSRMGYLAGKWIYLLDAVDDLEQDEKSGGYNVFLRLGCDRETAVRRAVGNLNVCVDELGKCIGLLGLSHYTEIVENIVFLGLPKMQKAVLEQKEKLDERPL